MTVTAGSSISASGKSSNPTSATWCVETEVAQARRPPDGDQVLGVNSALGSAAASMSRVAAAAASTPCKFEADELIVELDPGLGERLGVPGETIGDGRDLREVAQERDPVCPTPIRCRTAVRAPAALSETTASARNTRGDDRRRRG